MMLYIIVKF